MSSPEYARRHYGVVADAKPEPRLTSPENLARRTAAVTGIYETPSTPVPVAEKPEKSPFLIRLVSIPDEKIDVPWSKRKASGTKIVPAANLLAVQEPLDGLVP